MHWQKFKQLMYFSKYQKVSQREQKLNYHAVHTVANTLDTVEHSISAKLCAKHLICLSSWNAHLFPLLGQEPLNQEGF